jgi:broad specificity phosphatase PhoE
MTATSARQIRLIRDVNLTMINPIFYIVRHGHTKGNSRNEYRAWSNEPYAQLDGEGRDGVRESALWLQKSGQTFPLIISDDLDRAVETRKILQEILQIPVDHTDKLLRPVDVGDFTGKSKVDFPLDPYIKNKSKKIPGGESFNEFNARQSKFFEKVLEIVDKIGKPILLVGHGSTVAFLHNHFNKGAAVGYEGLVNPAGVLVFTSAGIEPLTNKREGAASSLAVGTATSGYVTPEENAPPRSCWHCRYFSRDAIDTPTCNNPIVRIDPALASQRTESGLVIVNEDGCCNYYTSPIGAKP